VLLARTEALDEVEAAAEQRFAAALAHDRADLAKQARSLLCTRGTCCNARAWFCRARMPQTVSETAAHALRVAAWGMRWWSSPRRKLAFHEGPCSAYQAVPSGQVHQARAEARAEAEAAAEQRLAALDQARRDEREAAVRAALALGVRRVRARPLSGMPLHVHLHDTQCIRHATKQLQSAPAGGPGMVFWLSGACRTLLTRAQPAKTMVNLRFCPVTAKDNASRQSAATA